VKHNLQLADHRIRRWAAGRWWHDGGGAAKVALAACVLPLLVLGWALHAARVARATQGALEDEWRASREALVVTAVPDVPEKRDFAAFLPVHAGSAEALGIVNDAAQRSAVAITAQQVQVLAPTPERLGRTELAIVTRGSYAAVKQWLGEVTDRLPASTLARLQLQRAEGMPELEAHATVVVWSRPASLGNGATARP
jgi:hypothetical protein